MNTSAKNFIKFLVKRSLSFFYTEEFYLKNKDHIVFGCSYIAIDGSEKDKKGNIKLYKNNQQVHKFITFDLYCLKEDFDDHIDTVLEKFTEKNNRALQGITLSCGFWSDTELTEYQSDLYRGFREQDVHIRLGMFLESDNVSLGGQNEFWDEIFPRHANCDTITRIFSGNRSQHGIVIFDYPPTREEYKKLTNKVSCVGVKLSNDDIIKFDSPLATKKVRIPGVDRYIEHKNDYDELARKSKIYNSQVKQNYISYNFDRVFLYLEIDEILDGLKMINPNDEKKEYYDWDPEQIELVNKLSQERLKKFKDEEENNREKEKNKEKIFYLMRQIKIEHSCYVLAHVGASYMTINGSKWQVAPDDINNPKSKHKKRAKLYQGRDGSLWLSSLKDHSEFAGGVNITKKYFEHNYIDIYKLAQDRLDQMGQYNENVGKKEAKKKKWSKEYVNSFFYRSREIIQSEDQYFNPQILADFCFSGYQRIFGLQGKTGLGKTTSVLNLSQYDNLDVTVIPPFNMIKKQKYLEVHNIRDNIIMVAKKMGITDEEIINKMYRASGKRENDKDDRFRCLAPEGIEKHINIDEHIENNKRLGRKSIFIFDEGHNPMVNGKFRKAYSRILKKLAKHVYNGDAKIVFMSATMDEIMIKVLKHSYKLTDDQVKWIFFQPKGFKPYKIDMRTHIPSNNDADYAMHLINEFIKKNKKAIKNKEYEVFKKLCIGLNKKESILKIKDTLAFVLPDLKVDIYYSDIIRIKEKDLKKQDAHVRKLIKTGQLSAPINLFTSCCYEGVDFLDRDITNAVLILDNTIWNEKTIVQFAGRFRVANVRYEVVFQNSQSKRKITSIEGLSNSIDNILMYDNTYSMVEDDSLYQDMVHDEAISCFITASEIQKRVTCGIMKNHLVVDQYLAGHGIEVKNHQILNKKFFEELRETEIGYWKKGYNQLIKAGRHMRRAGTYIWNDNIRCYLNGTFNNIQISSNNTDPKLAKRQIVMQIHNRYKCKDLHLKDAFESIAPDFKYKKQDGIVAMSLEIKNYKESLIKYLEQCNFMDRLCQYEDVIRDINFGLKLSKYELKNLKEYIGMQNETILRLKEKNQGLREAGETEINITYQITQHLKNYLEALFVRLDVQSSRIIAADKERLTSDDWAESLFKIDIKNGMVHCILDLENGYQTNQRPIKNLLEINQPTKGDNRLCPATESNDYIYQKAQEFLNSSWIIDRSDKILIKSNYTIAIFIELIKRHTNPQEFIETELDKQIVKKRSIEYNGIQVKGNRIIIKFADILKTKAKNEETNEILQTIIRNNQSNFRNIVISYSMKKIRRILQEKNLAPPHGNI